MIHLNLYKYTNKPIIVDKTSYLGTPLTITGDVPSTNQDMENPTIYLKNASEYDYNYAYIQEYHRYYFLTNKTWMGGNVWSFSWHVDELYTYRALVLSLSGLVRYSKSGDSSKFDDRLNYNVPPVRSVAQPYAGYGGDTGYGTPMIMMRHYTSGYDSTLLGQNNVQSSVAIEYMSPAAYMAFCINYAILYSNASTESVAVAIGASIIDITVVWYSDVFTVTADNKIIFGTPAIIKENNSSPYTMTLTAPDILPANVQVYHADIYNTIGLPSAKRYDFLIAAGYYWNRIAKRTLFLPFVGNIEIDPEKLGLGGSGAYTLRASVRHEPGENVYVVTLSSVVGTVTTTYNIQRKTTAVSTTMPIFIDASFNNKDSVEQLKLFNLIAQGVSLGGGFAQYGGVFPGSIMRFAGTATGTMLELEQLKFNDAMSIQTQGILGGSPDLLDIYSIYLETLTTPPADDYVSFWADHGYPDGAHRDLADLSGYVKMQEFEMIYNSNATKGEMDRLEQQLYDGVIL